MVRDKNKALEGIEQVVSEVGRNILDTPADTLLNSYAAAMNGLSLADPINILPDRTVPLINTSIVMAHNAYNSISSGSMWPNQQLSLTELLDIGVRGLELDVHWDKGEARLCHELCTPKYADIVLGYNRPLADALKEVQTWLDKHPSETIILKFEDYLDPKKYGAPIKELSKLIAANLKTSSIFTPNDLNNSFKGQWPSIDQMNALGKQLVLMPQNSGQDQSLYFNGDWGKVFKNPFNTGTIAKVQPNNLSVTRISNIQLIEVGEDRTFVGSLVDNARKIPLLGRLIPNDVVAGQMTKEDIQALRKNGVNLISLDKIEHNDSRLSSSMTLSDVRNNAYVFIPVAIAAAALTPRDQGDKSLSTTAQRSLIQLLVATTLPDEARVLYNAVETGITAYKASTEEAARANNVITVFDKVKAIGSSLITATSKAVETVVKIGLSNITAQSISSSTVASATIVGTASKTVVNVIAAKVITEPIIGAVTGALTGKGVTEGFLGGVDYSTFGLTSFGAKKSNQTPIQLPITSTPTNSSTETVRQSSAHRPITRSMDTHESHAQNEIRKRLTKSQTKGQLQGH